MEDSAPDPAESGQPIENEPDVPPTPPSQIVCPQCGGAIDPQNVSGPIIECPHCATQFFPPVIEDDADKSADDSKEEDVTEAELSELRIRQLITLQRTAYRTRSYLVVGTLGCLGFAVQLGIFAFQVARANHRWGSAPIAYLLFAGAGLIGSYKFGVRVMEVQRGINADARARELEEQEAARHEPDLSTLSDGSHHARNLASMFANERDPEKRRLPESGPNSAGE
jgi:hypothetical protein